MLESLLMITPKSFLRIAFGGRRFSFIFGVNTIYYILIYLEYNGGRLVVYFTVNNKKLTKSLLVYIINLTG